MSLRWTDDDAQLLRRLREASGLERVNFARRNSLSPAQLEELEGAGQGRFYNDRIKAHTGHTLLRKLGHAPAAAAAARAGLRADGIEAVDAPPPTSPAAAPVAVPRQAPITQPVHLPQPAAGSRRVSPMALALLGLAAAAAGVFVATGAGWPPLAPAAPQPVAAAARPQPEAAAAAGRPAAEAAPVLAVAAEVQGAAASPARCGPVPQAGLTRFTPPGAIRPANYVHLEAAREVPVCVVDATGKPTAAVVQPGEGLSVYGEPPFVVQASQWNELRVFFQGMRVHLDPAAPPVALALDPR